MTSDLHLFTRSILHWYRKHKREMPWRDSGNPYFIWVSEIMLQQTRVEQAKPYFEGFISEFPTVHDLAEASTQDVLKAWEGLGYYSRARNLHHAAKTVVRDNNGHIPNNYDELLTLKGIGPYTAAAISSIAFNEPKAVVDGNVMRVICRYLGIEEDIRKSEPKKQVQAFMDEMIPDSDPGDFNQAVMELGSQVCTPSSPSCTSCPVSAACIACETAKTDVIPYKSPARKKPHKIIGVGIIEDDSGKVLIARRPEDAMLGGLWEFPGGKKEKDENIRETVQRELKEELGVEVAVHNELMQLKHTYSHFSITLHAYFCTIEQGTPKPKSATDIKWVKKNELEQFPFPKANKMLTQKLLDS